MSLAAQPVWARWWPAGLAWALWLLTMLALAAIPWLDRLLLQAGQPGLEQWDLRPGWRRRARPRSGRCWPAADLATRWAGSCSPRSLPC